MNLSNTVLCDLCGGDTLHTESTLSNHFLGTGHWRWPDIWEALTTQNLLLTIGYYSFWSIPPILLIMAFSQVNSFSEKVFIHLLFDLWVDIQGLCSHIIKYFWFFTKKINTFHCFSHLLQTYERMELQNFAGIVKFIGT